MGPLTAIAWRTLDRHGALFPLEQWWTWETVNWRVVSSNTSRASGNPPHSAAGSRSASNTCVAEQRVKDIRSSSMWTSTTDRTRAALHAGPWERRQIFYGRDNFSIDMEIALPANRCQTWHKTGWNALVFHMPLSSVSPSVLHPFFFEFKGNPFPDRPAQEVHVASTNKKSEVRTGKGEKTMSRSQMREEKE